MGGGIDEVRGGCSNCPGARGKEEGGWGALLWIRDEESPSRRSGGGPPPPLASHPSGGSSDSDTRARDKWGRAGGFAYLSRSRGARFCLLSPSLSPGAVIKEVIEQ